MGSENYPHQTKGIFRNLPTFDPSIKGKTAIVTGANGISGFHTMRVLLESPQRWTKVWAASRRPPPPEMMKLLPEEARSRVEHVACDFLNKPEDIAKQLQEKGVKADTVFFYSYAQPTPKEGAPAWSNAQELCDVNAALLENFLKALDIASITPDRFLLQTGAKNYNVHQGPARTPFIESAGRTNIEPNFYYPQEDLLFQYCRDHPSTSWNVICPAWIIGATTNASMNALHPLAVYAAVQAHKGETLQYPGAYENWLATGEHSTAYLTSYLSEWAVLEDKCKNQKFNASDTCHIANNRLWPEVARWYGTSSVSEPVLDESQITTLQPPPGPTPVGYGPTAKIRFAWSMQSWAAEEVNQKAWKEMTSKHKLTHNPFEAVKGSFEFGDMIVWALVSSLSMNKARRFGWTGYVDTMEGLFMAYDEMSRIGMLPPMVVERAEPLI
ncbi:hypothetical protein CLAFUW4_08847 [Fulvia fulva]|uniref:PRISE-like Rossmann-fold domain-containing protein n=1 Tax=Passalora fulva TaxID=5499 RepID=A0A9Q8PGV6_PASFU|nr:uncharacterized protein CLAFUR5_08953 [Fulvia fulva]KAK4613686.1 hypothetical protein CLAFUR4_08853 [Fulvia fulva]KAK4614686.1 hypothetical protein CLAFUR0_08845 [Fulvia fulva]UJO22394.1 hypothetical protein CLAFUR5_08953 [Fulvia fulva]WPV20572.1 hypothetical protein CLAFUW4_08847 [Fulvia fulva]WPV34928.1 hypothetical protein CLAFUW7_08848 [Fulvia fulva]